MWRKIITLKLISAMLFIFHEYFTLYKKPEKKLLKFTNSMWRKIITLKIISAMLFIFHEYFTLKPEKILQKFTNFYVT